jgi:SAM-dependent methyltransferase
MPPISFSDHFSSHAADYLKYRPTYPIELAQYLSTLTQTPSVAWDCGCGNGQLSTLLAEYFQRVIATDASAAQIHNAIPHPQVDYRCATAEQSSLENESVDLIMVAQAAHWFDLPKFYEEVQRVAKPQAIIALVTYNLMRISPQLDEIIDDFYENILGNYWSPERRHVENNYVDLFFPFKRLPSPDLNITAELSCESVINYINTWSAIRPAKQQLGLLPFETFENKLKENWGDPMLKKTIRWHLTVLLGKIK